MNIAMFLIRDELVLAKITTDESAVSFLWTALLIYVIHDIFFFKYKFLRINSILIKKKIS